MPSLLAVFAHPDDESLGAAKPQMLGYADARVPDSAWQLT